MNLAIKEDCIQDKKCSGKDCKNLGSISLKILYINKIGLFCEPCSNDLLQQELATKIEESEAH